MRAAIFALTIAIAACGAPPLTRAATDTVPETDCPDTSAGLALPDGFCATQVVTGAGSLRQVTVSETGVVYVARQDRRSGSGVLVFQRSADGHLDAAGGFGPPGANDVEIREGFVYVAYPDRIVRWSLQRSAVPTGDGEVVVGGLPAEGGHTAKSLAFKADTMVINVGSRTNSCQTQDRELRSPGIDPCVELERRAGLWSFAAGATGLTFEQGERYATGLRNVIALAVEPASGELFFAVHGRDQLAQNWEYPAETSASDPAEEFGIARRGDDFGWPYCYYSNVQRAKVRAPEYGGDGTSTAGCDERAQPLIAFPGHWAPMAIAFHDGTGLGTAYRGAFLAFHGSWNRAPLPQEGFRVVFVPFSGGRPEGSYSTFAMGEAGPTSLRAAGVAVGPDGSLYITDDRSGSLWRVSKPP